MWCLCCLCGCFCQMWVVSQSFPRDPVLTSFGWSFWMWVLKLSWSPTLTRFLSWAVGCIYVVGHVHLLLVWCVSYLYGCFCLMWVVPCTSLVTQQSWLVSDGQFGFGYWSCLGVLTLTRFPGWAVGCIYVVGHVHPLS